MNRPKLNELLDFVWKGDTAIVEAYSRLVRSTKDHLFIIDKLHEKKVSFVSLKESIDTITEGIAISKAEGKYKGRKPIDKPRDRDYVIGLYKAKEITATQAQKRLVLSHATFYRMLACD